MSIRLHEMLPSKDVINLFGSCLAAAALASGAAAGPKEATEKSNMDIEKLKTMLAAKDDETPDYAREVGPAGIPVLIQYLSDPDPSVRLTAVDSLYMVDSPAAIAGFCKALDDGFEPVRSSAVNSLWVRHDASILPTLYRGLKSNPYFDARSMIPLIIGLIGERASLSVLQGALNRETNNAIRLNISLAMARLGNTMMQEVVAERLGSKEIPEILKAVQDVVYVNDRKVGRRLAPLLSDRRQAYRVGSSAARRDARICDAAINAVSEIYGRPFSFEADRNNVYTDKQLAEVTRFFEKLPP